MKFAICSVGVWHNPTKIVEEYPCVNDFGFETEHLTKYRTYRLREPYDGIEKVTEEYTIDVPYVNIDSLDRLMEFCRAVNNPIIIGSDDGIPEIEIYDGYRE